MDKETFKFGTQATAELRRFLANKGLRPAFDWDEVAEEEHAFSFTVAKATELDVLTTIKASLEKAQAAGVPFEAWQKGLRPELQKLGWWGKKTLRGRRVQLGSSRRLKTIYRANIRTAHAAAQYTRAMRRKAALPFFIYELGPSETHRAAHVRWQGMIAPVDHAIWDTLYPPNGWGCKCRLRQISRAEAERRGYDAKNIPELKYDEDENGQLVARGVDASWGTNPGKARAQTLHNLANRRIVEAPPAWSATALRDWQATDPDGFARGFAGWAEGVLDSRGRNKEVHAVGVLSPKVRAQAQRLKLAADLVVIDGGGLFHLVEHAKKAKGKTIPKEMVLDLPAIIARPDQVLVEVKSDGTEGNLVYVKAIAGEKDKVARVIVQPSRTSKADDSAIKRERVVFNTVISASRVDGRDLKDSKSYREIK